LVALKDERVSMLLVEQNAEMALQLADHVYVIDDGAVVFEGGPEELRADRQAARRTWASGAAR
jgi:branched-chain amino acid transport system ATP-binding protein